MKQNFFSIKKKKLKSTKHCIYAYSYEQLKIIIVRKLKISTRHQISIVENTNNNIQNVALEKLLGSDSFALIF